MALLYAPLQRPIIYSIEDILARELEPYANLKYLLEEIVILSIPKGLVFVEPNMMCFTDTIFYDFTVKHCILIDGLCKSVDINVLITITYASVTVKIRSVYDAKTEIYKCVRDYMSIEDNYIDISLFVKQKIQLFIKAPLKI
jgi:hypothetical protein